MDTTGDAYPSNNWIANKLSVHRTTVIQSLNRLCARGYIIRQEINGYRHLSTITSPLQEDLVVSALRGSSANTTPPSSASTTQLDQSNITSKNINNIVDSTNTPLNKNDKSLKTLNTNNYRKHPLYQTFLLFYMQYPNKQKPFEAFKAFIKLKPTQELVDILVADIQNRRAKDSRWQIRKYIPHPATYLNTEYWLGDIVAIEKKQSGQFNQQHLQAEKQTAERERQAKQAKQREIGQAKALKNKLNEQLGENDRTAGKTALQSLKQILKGGFRNGACAT